MRRLKRVRQFAFAAIPALCLALPFTAEVATAQANKAARTQGQFGDGIAAVVNTEIITLRELNNRMATLRISGGDTSSRDQVLQSMIDEKLMKQDAARLGVEVSDAQMNQVLATIAQRNNISLERLQEEVGRSGMNWDEYLKNLHNEVVVDQLRSRIIQSRISVTEADIDAFLKQHPTGILPRQEVRYEAPPPQKQVVVERSFEPKAIGLQHIYIRVPDNASEDVVEAARKKANEAMAKLRRGTSFAAVAREYSNAPEASSGGELGIRMFEDWPKLFVDVTRNVADGRTTGVFKAPNGFHILKVKERRGIVKENKRVVTVQPPAPPRPQPSAMEVAAKQEGPVNITESHVRHILVKISPVVSDQQAYQRIQSLHHRLSNGESFEDVARKFSQDSSAPLGGDIGWIAPGVADPEFERAVAGLQEGQISNPVRSAFGWHIIEVLDRRTGDKKTEIRRTLARQSLYEQRAEPIYVDWLQQLRSQSFIDNRLSGSISARN
ncbi:MAG: peptidylprolyl isomerase [Alcaligenaceae bacterium]|nr:peptidylprolyl isomerase [Alcaligenaceae bacterium]